MADLNTKLIDVPKARVSVFYNTRNITASIADDLLEITYNDKLNGESDELDITLVNEGRWINDWYPAKGDTLTASIDYKGVTLDCGTFEIDEIEVSLKSQTITIHALATGLSSPLRTKRSQAFEATTLADIAAKFARQHNLALSGQIREIPIDRATQYHETDLHFLKRVGKLNGYLFSVKKGQLLFSELAELRNLQSSYIVTPDMVASDSIKDKIKGVYSAVEQKRHDALKRRTIHHSRRAKLADSPNSTSSDTLRHHHRAHTKGAAQVQSQAALDHANVEKTTGSLEFTDGDARARSGVAFDLQGWGVLSGRYQIDNATHTVSRSSGYSSSVEIKRIDQLPVLSKPQASGKTAPSIPKTTAKSHVKILKGK